MNPPQRGGSMTGVKAERLSFDILEEKKTGKSREEEKKRRKKIRLTKVSENMIDRQ